MEDRGGEDGCRGEGGKHGGTGGIGDGGKGGGCGDGEHGGICDACGASGRKEEEGGGAGVSGAFCSGGNSGRGED